MRLNGKTVLVCNCEKTMSIDGAALGKACGSDAVEVHSQLCRAQIVGFERAVDEGAPVLVACTQESPLFEELRSEHAPDATIRYTNIRERAGWSDEGKNALPKMAALLSEAVLDMPDVPAMTITSEGVALVYGKGQEALEAAQQLAGRLDVTLLLKELDGIVPPSVNNVPVVQGTIAAAKGALGGFEIVVDDYATLSPSSRRGFSADAARDGAVSRCDLILDLTGEAPLFPAHDRRDGYFRPDPGNPAAVQKALFDIADMVGEYEKPRYVTYQADICAHARSGITGCTRCLDVCPTSAITPDGDHVVIDPHVCAGCGSCASVCPTGAATYAMPAPDALFQRLRILLAAYRDGGGKRPVLLLHDFGHGEELVSLMARFGRGLPRQVLPFGVNEVTQVGLDFLAGAFAYGASQVHILVSPRQRDELDGLAAQIGLAETALSGLGYGEGRISIVDAQDPSAVEDILYGLEQREAPAAGQFLPLGGKRTLTMLALRHLHDRAPQPVDELPLPTGAPFGAVEVDVEGCTLCLACVGACPTGALLDNPEAPQLSFNEDACVQCGLCRNTCPESVIALTPRLNFREEARGAVLIKEEAPFECIRCGKPFATRSSVEAVVARLSEHSMFRDEGALDRIRMCEDCRVQVQFEVPDNPLAAAPRPITRTTDDYIREREEALQEERKKLREEALAEQRKNERGRTEPSAPENGAKPRRPAKAKER